MATDIRTHVTGRTLHPAKVTYTRKDEHHGTAIEGAIIALAIEIIGITAMVFIVKGILFLLAVTR